ncbi:hypothetical protein NC651_036137 [Populus alba x Populus x berolinensis]|nr:hypothetical protein NC651_036137 [Populus alba x Populus x berolinensis]
MKFDYSFKSGFVIGYIVFFSCNFFYILLCTMVVYGRGGKKITISEMMMLMVKRKHKITDDDQAGSSPTAGLLEEGIKEISMLEKRVTRMSYADLNDATDNFSENNVIGQGKMGMLYKASLPNGYNFQPKLSNFGEAMLVSSTCASSVNSEFWEMAFVKEDVHGFGVVLLEMITGVDPSNMTASSNNVLNKWIGHLSSSSDFHGAIDKSLIGKGFDDEIIQLLKVACTCVDPIPDRRPIMVQVYEDIKAIRERCDLVDDSSMLKQPEICPATSEKSVEIEMAEFQ